MKTFTKDELINKLLEIKSKGWIKNARYGNCGGVGNTLEDLLGIKENNLPLLLTLIPSVNVWCWFCAARTV